MQKKMNSFLLVGIIGTLITGSDLCVQYGRARWGNRDIWWTPKTLAVSLDETKQQFEMFIGDELLQSHLERKSLSATGRNGDVYPVVPADIKVRLNNWYQTKASFLGAAILPAFLLGISVTCLILGIAPRLQARREDGEGRRAQG